MKATLFTKIAIFVTVLAVASATASNGAQNDYTNLCYDGQNPSKWSDKKKLEEFAKGPCSPVVILPGISGSNLNVEIDCKKLKDSDNDTFKTCGWACCGSLCLVKPKSEYRIWIPSPFAPMSIITPFKKSKNCFAGLIEPSFDYSSGKMVFKPKPGVTIKPVGATPESNTKKEGHCAFDGIQNMLKDLPNTETIYFKKVRERLEDMGYETGLTMQALPYDWRLANGMDRLGQGFLQLLEQMKALTNKRATIIAHSMGNLRTAHLLWSMNQQQKDNLINNWISAAPPFIGANVDVVMLTCGSDAFEFAFGLGLDLDTFRASVGSFPSTLQLLPYQTYLTQKDQTWMKKIMSRIEYEEGRSSDPVFSWLPRRDQICYPDFPSTKTCRSGLKVLDNYGTTHDGVKITNANFKEVMKKYSFYKNLDVAWGIRDQRFETLPNFGVPLTLVYINKVDTPETFDFKQNPQIWATEKGDYCTHENGGYNMGHTPGDEVVPSTSPVTAGIKMAYDFDTGVPGSKPVKFVDYCSTYNMKNSPFDDVGANGEKIISENGYIGLPCDCKEGDIEGNGCTHNGMFKNAHLIDFVANTLNTNDRTQITPTTAGKPESFFKDWVDNCRLFNNHVAEFTVGVGEVSISEE